MIQTVKSIRFCVHGAPVGKARPRVTKSGHAYTPQKTKDYEAIVRACYQSQVGRGRFPAGVPLTVKITAEFPIPKSTSKKRAAALIGRWHTKKPDADNVAKAILDALNGYAYPDDSAVSKLTAEKVYGEPPGVYVQITGEIPEP